MKYLTLLAVLIIASSCTSGNKNNLEVKAPEISKQKSPEGYDPEKRLEELGLQLQEISAPLANYVHAVRAGNLVFLAGKGPKNEVGETIIGKLGDEYNVDQGYAAAKSVGIQQLSVLKSELGNLNKIKRIVQVTGMVNAVPEFKDHSKVINGYSDLMVDVFGDRGKHARAAVGMGSLPNNMAVEIEMVVEIFED
ncbi:RidA family protein [Maribacter luteus]|uniref:RidA family protein n=1 Tax=Maribacter luteus TaxID=2594478 RepID=A0A6I2MNN8_9FLAO|nr:RidA family protein [Maribacter luteus]MRX64120.1 RidA family protein [Maribacter luteus]|tara:strand:- start:2166 stop:2747 length:582 start_codon:yes stop_codon:yes gene_type:complete